MGEVNDDDDDDDGDDGDDDDKNEADEHACSEIFSSFVLFLICLLSSPCQIKLVKKFSSVTLLSSMYLDYPCICS